MNLSFTGGFPEAIEHPPDLDLQEAKVTYLSYINSMDMKTEAVDNNHENKCVCNVTNIIDGLRGGGDIPYPKFY